MKTTENYTSYISRRRKVAIAIYTNLHEGNSYTLFRATFQFCSEDSYSVEYSFKEVMQQQPDQTPCLWKCQGL